MTWRAIFARPYLEERLAPNYKSANILEEWVVQSVSGEAEAGAYTPPPLSST